MKNKMHGSLWLMAGLLLTMPLWAHHSITAEFDTSKSFTVKGTLTKIEWASRQSAKIRRVENHV